MSTQSLPITGDWPGDHNLIQPADLVIYYINADDQIVAVNAAWNQFAADNNGADLILARIQYASLWTFISDQDTRLLYKHLFAHMRARGQSITLPFRCDSPLERRFMQLTMTPMVTGGIRFASYLLRTELREYQPWLDVDAPRIPGWIEMCSWCKRVRNEAAHWVAIEAAIESMQLFETVRPPQISHSICPACVAQIEHELMP